MLDVCVCVCVCAQRLLKETRSDAEVQAKRAWQGPTTTKVRNFCLSVLVVSTLLVIYGSCLFPIHCVLLCSPCSPCFHVLCMLDLCVCSLFSCTCAPSILHLFHPLTISVMCCMCSICFSLCSISVLSCSQSIDVLSLSIFSQLALSVLYVYSRHHSRSLMLFPFPLFLLR